MTTTTKPTPTGRPLVRIGVLVPSEVQLLDLACVDLFAMMGIGYLGQLEGLPRALTGLAPEVAISYVGTADRAPTTAQTALACSHLVADPEVAPGKLDIVLVPGPDPTAKWGEDVKAWLRAQAAREEVDVLSVCTGIFLVGDAGLLEGRKTVCGPRGLQKMIKERYAGVRCVGDKYRWTRDGNLWTSGGVTNGNDLVIAYARQTPRFFPGPLVEFSAQIADVGDRPRELGSQAVWGLGMAWHLLKAWFVGATRAGKGKSKSV